jgi:hypothetical protein
MSKRREILGLGWLLVAVGVGAWLAYILVLVIAILLL